LRAHSKGFWLRGLGAWGNWNARGTAAAVDRYVGGVLAGVDIAAGPATVGLFGGYTRTDLDSAATRSEARSGNLHIGAQAAVDIEGLSARIGGAHSWHNLTVDRVIQSRGFSDTTSADYDARTAQAFGELGYRIETTPAAFEPFATLAYAHIETEAFTERGGSAALHGDSAAYDSAFSTLGLRASTSLGEAVTLDTSGGWNHAFTSVSPSTRITFADASRFEVAGLPLDADTAVLSAVLKVEIAKNLDIRAQYTGQHSKRIFDNGANATVNWQF